MINGCEAHMKIRKLDEETNAALTNSLLFAFLYLLVRFKLHYRQISIITHGDFDGIVSAAFVLQKFPYSRLYFATSRNIHKLLYVAKQHSSREIPHTIYILDLAIPEEFGTRIIKAIKDIRRDALIEIIWIDHHQSPHLHEIHEYVNLLVYPNVSHAAYLVQKYVNNAPCANIFLDLLQGGTSEYTAYWRPVLQAVTKFQHVDDHTKVLTTRYFASKTKNDFTDVLRAQELADKRQESTPPQKEFKLLIYWTQQNRLFGLIAFYRKVDLYAEVRRKLRLYGLEFLLVQFEDRTLSAYKSGHSTIDLTPLFELVGGKGHPYAFHFQPQMRISDEFYRPMSIQCLIKKIQEMF